MSTSSGSHMDALAQSHATGLAHGSAWVGIVFYALALLGACLHRQLLRSPNSNETGWPIWVVRVFAAARVLWEFTLLVRPSVGMNALAAIADATASLLHFIIFGAAYQTMASTVFTSRKLSTKVVWVARVAFPSFGILVAGTGIAELSCLTHFSGSVPSQLQASVQCAEAVGRAKAIALGGIALVMVVALIAFYLRVEILYKRVSAKKGSRGKILSAAIFTCAFIGFVRAAVMFTAAIGNAGCFSSSVCRQSVQAVDLRYEMQFFGYLLPELLPMLIVTVLMRFANGKQMKRRRLYQSKKAKDTLLGYRAMEIGQRHKHDAKKRKARAKEDRKMASGSEKSAKLREAALERGLDEPPRPPKPTPRGSRVANGGGGGGGGGGGRPTARSGGAFVEMASLKEEGMATVAEDEEVGNGGGGAADLEAGNAAPSPAGGNWGLLRMRITSDATSEPSEEWIRERQESRDREFERQESNMQQESSVKRGLTFMEVVQAAQDLVKGTSSLEDMPETAFRTTYSYMPAGGEAASSSGEAGGVTVQEAMEESAFMWQTTAAYLPIVQRCIQTHVETLRQDILREGLTSNMSEDQLRAAGQGLLRAAQDGPMGGDSGTTVLQELLMDIAAALPCSRLQWLQVMHHFHMGLLNSLNGPLAAANDPNVMLPASNLPPYTFKPSRVKNEWLLAFEPTNCHTQQIVVVAPEGEHRYESVTMGAPAAHARSFKAGGLEQIRSKLKQFDARLDKRLEMGGEGEVAKEVRARLVQRREWLLYQRAQRFSLCISQGLAGLITIFYRRLQNCLATRDVTSPTYWAKVGFLVGWESLLSTRGKEAKMLGDICGCIEALQSLRLRLARMPPEAGDARPQVGIDRMGDPPPTRSVTSGLLARQTSCMASSNSRAQKSSLLRKPSAGHGVTSEEAAAYRGAGAEHGPLIITLAIPAEEFDRLPDALTGSVERGARPPSPSSADGSARSSEAAPGSFGFEARNTGDDDDDEAQAAPPSAAGAGAGAGANGSSSSPPSALPAVLCGDWSAVSTATIHICTCLFTQGVNEEQTIANMRGKTEIQEEINRRSMATLEGYLADFAAYLLRDADPEATKAAAAAATKAAKQLAAASAAEDGKASLPRKSVAACIQSVASAPAPAPPDPNQHYRATLAPGSLVKTKGGGSRKNLSLPGGVLVSNGVIYTPVGDANGGGGSGGGGSGGGGSGGGGGGGGGGGNAGGIDVDALLWRLRGLMTDARDVVDSVEEKGAKKKKDTRVLTLTAQAVRLMGGGRIVSCKSGKDRTSMSVTAEQVELLVRYHGLPPEHMGPLLDNMRRDGARMENTVKNVGKGGYAFNALQRLLLPAALTPKANTTASVQS